jgi:hypothetical protein
LAVGGLRLTSESTASAATAGTKAVTSGAEGRTPEEARPVVEGIVTDAATGKPVAGARIFLFRLKVKEALQGHNQWVAGKPVVTDAKGQFTLLAESPGVFRLEVQAPNYLSVHTEEFPLRAGEKVSRPVSLQPIPAHLRPGLITGVVKGARDQTPLDVRVRGRGLWVDFDWTAFGPSPSPDWGGGSGRPSFTTSSDLPSSGEYDLSASLETDAEGRFIFSFPSGNYTLRFTLPDGRGQEFPDRAIYPGAKTELTITPGPLPPDTEPSLFPSHPLTESLQLTVLRPEGTPLANRRIYLFQYTVNEAGQVVGWPAGGGSFEKTDERGCVDFPTNPGTHGWWVKTADFAEGRVPPMTITAGQPARATVRLPGPAVKLVIRVRANDGQPIPHALAVAARLNAFEGSPGGVRSITASSDFWKFGFVERFLDGLGPGLVEEMSKAGEIGELLGLMQRGHYVAITDGRGEAALPDLEPGTYFVGAAAQGFAREAPIRLNVGERGARREFILRPLARLIGVVRRPDGHPLANVELTVKGQTRAGEPWWEKIYTDSRGRYTLAVAEDTVRLLFQRNGWVPAEIKPAGLTPGEKKTIDIPMDRGATVKGSVIATGLGATLPPGLIVKAIQGWGRSQWTRVADDGTYVLTGLEVGPCHLEVRLGGSGALDEVEVTIREPRQVLGASMMIGGPAVRMER